MAREPKKWIAGAIKRPGALRATAKRAGLLKGEEKLSGSDLAKLGRRAERTGNTRLQRQVNLARTLRKF